MHTTRNQADNNKNTHRNRSQRVAGGILGTIAAGFLLASTSVSAGVITEDFSGGVFDTNNFEIGAGSGTAASGAYVGVNRGTLRTVADDLYGTAANPLTVSADLTFSGWDIAFLAVRSSGVPADGNNEPSNGLFLRLHNQHNNGQTNIAEGANYGAFTTHPPGGNAFFNNTVRVTLTDYGNLVELNLKNLTTNVEHDFSVNSSYSSGFGHVAFASNTASWDNISIGHGSLGSAGVPEPATALLIALGLAGVVRRRR